MLTDSLNNRIRRIATDGIITTFAGTGQANFSGDGGSPLNAQFNNPRGLAITSTGGIVVSDRSNHRIRLLENNIIQTVAGSGTPGFSGDNGNAKLAQLNFPWGVAVGPNGRVVIADRQNNRVRMLTSSAYRSSSISAMLVLACLSVFFFFM